jgi:RNA methyltransferase, TrmH family
MISKNQISFVRSLQQKKYRLKYGCFVAEGNKIVVELLNSNWAVEQIFATNFFIEKFKIDVKKNNINIVSKIEIEKISGLFSPTDAIAIVKIPTAKIPDFNTVSWSLALDDIQDPGNLGTIIRTADWFGVKQIFLSENCVDVYNSKTIQASMGSFLRVNFFETNLSALIEEKKFKQIAVAVMDGQNIFNTTFEKSGLMIVGNEGNGVSEKIISMADLKITIPKIGQAESLNVAVAAGIVCSCIVK